MHGLYNKLQEDCKTGPFRIVNGQKELKPFEEYPKWVTKADGKRVIVTSLREEAAMAGERLAPSAHDPLANEREALAAEGEKVKASLSELDELKAQMRAQLDELAQARAALQGSPGATNAAQAKPSVGSSYRLPPEAKGAAPKAEPEKVA
jgi:hypothetical protein